MNQAHTPMADQCLPPPEEDGGNDWKPIDPAEFLSVRLANVARIVGYPMPKMSHADIAEVAGTILGSIASILNSRAATSQAMLAVLDERSRQVGAYGYDSEHDDAFVNDEIAAYAALYAMPEGARDWCAESTGYGDTLGKAMLPSEWLMPDFGTDRRRQLVKAGALILAEIERLDRAAQAEGGTHA